MNHRPRKRFGQHFLHDPGSIQHILTSVAPQPGQKLVEIGPGQGAISEGLLRATGALDVIELDRDLVAPLAKRLGRLGDLRIHNADALRFDLYALADSSIAECNRLRIVGNLPYNISTPLLFRFLDQAECIDDLHLMLQKEVVERICADPGSKTYGRLSVMVQTRCSTQRLFVIRPGAFNPPPKVDSAMLRLIPHRPTPCPVDDAALHARIVTAAFAQRRKSLRNSLKGLVQASLLIERGIDPAARAEMIPVHTYADLANALHANQEVGSQGDCLS